MAVCEQAVAFWSGGTDDGRDGWPWCGRSVNFIASLDNRARVQTIETCYKLFGLE